MRARSAPTIEKPFARGAKLSSSRSVATACAKLRKAPTGLNCSWTRGCWRGKARASAEGMRRTHRNFRYHLEAIESVRIRLHNGKPGRCCAAVTASFCLLPLHPPHAPQPDRGAAWSAATLRGSRDLAAAVAFLRESESDWPGSASSVSPAGHAVGIEVFAYHV